MAKALFINKSYYWFSVIVLLIFIYLQVYSFISNNKLFNIFLIGFTVSVFFTVVTKNTNSRKSLKLWSGFYIILFGLNLILQLLIYNFNIIQSFSIVGTITYVMKITLVVMVFQGADKYILKPKTETEIEEHLIDRSN